MVTNTVIPRLKLSAVFSSLSPEFVLGTTYTLSLAFFESVVFPHIERKHLKRCVILCDQIGLEMAMSEAPALRSAARDYMVATAPSRGAFHPKVWVLLAEDELLVLAGSGNLTQPGFIENVEMFDVARVRADGPGRELAADVLVFLRGIADLWKGVSDPNLLMVRSLSEMISALEEFESRLTFSADPLVRLLSNFTGTFPSQLSSLGAETAYLAAPYFGNSVKGLERLHSAIRSKKTFVFPSWHRDGALDLPIEQAAALSGVRIRSLQLAADRRKFAHLKIYGFKAPTGQAWLFTGSVNCTVEALEGANIEAGMLRRVSPQIVDEYFEGSELATGDSCSHFNFEGGSIGWLILWATDLGDQISIELAPTNTSQRPLVNAVIEVRSGQKRASLSVSEVFARSGTERISWSRFGDFRTLLTGVAVIRITATDAQGNPVTGQCLVDDYATLTSEPGHRSAWHGALSLIGSEGMPAFAEFSALMELTSIVVDDESEVASDVSATASKHVAGTTKEPIRDKAAVWPPRPLLEEAAISGHQGRSAGNIYWFNRILATLLNKVTPETEVILDRADTVDAGDDDAAKGKSTVKDLKFDIDDRNKLAPQARRLWKQASEEFETLRERLCELEVTKAKAPRIWGAATIIFLGVLGIRQTFRRKGIIEDESIPTTTSLARTWLAMLLADRDQGDDYAPNRESTYEGQYFPSLAYDLWSRFQAAPHPEILAIVCVAFAHAGAASRFDKHHKIPVVQWLLLKDLAADLLAEATRDSDALQHQWEIYFRDDKECVTWNDIQNEMTALNQLTWMDHPGMQDLRELRGIAIGRSNSNQSLLDPLRRRLSMFRSAHFRIRSVSRFRDSCGYSRCARYGIQTAEIQGLRDLKPVICPSCGCLLVPDLLNQAFRRIQRGRTA